MIAFQKQKIGLIGLSYEDIGLVGRYSKYSDYILRNLGEWPEAATEPVKYIDIALRRMLVYMSWRGQQFITDQTEKYQEDIGVVCPATEYTAVVAVSPNIQERVAEIEPARLRDVMRTFETRLPNRFEKINKDRLRHDEDAADGFVWLVEHIGRPPAPEHNIWRQNLSFPSMTASEHQRSTRQMVEYPWATKFPAIFDTQQDLSEIQGKVKTLVDEVARARRTTPGTVAKLLKVRMP